MLREFERCFIVPMYRLARLSTFDCECRVQLVRGLYSTWWQSAGGPGSPKVLPMTSVPLSHFHAIAMPGVLWRPIPSCSVASEVDLPALSRSRNAPETAGFVYVLAGFALAPPTRVERVTFGLGNRCSVL